MALSAILNMVAIVPSFLFAFFSARYTDTMPQPTDPKTMPLVIMGTFLVYGVPIIGWILTLIALKNTPVTQQAMVEVQKQISGLKTKEE